MKTRHGFLRLAALAIVMALPLVGVSSIASAASATPNPAAATRAAHKGSPKWCAHHPKKALKVSACSSAASGGPAGGGATSPALTIQVDPNPDIETGESNVDVIVQVEASPAFAGDTVDVSSTQLRAACSGYLGFVTPNEIDTFGFAPVVLPLVLDDDGNATIAVIGSDCAPGTSVIEADLTVAPYLTALTTLVADPPVVTPSGLTGVPTTSGTVTGGEVDTGDTTQSGNSDIYAVFTLETDPVYAEQPAEISMNELVSRCGYGALVLSFGPHFEIISGNGSDPSVTTLDDDGNATFIFAGGSCAAGSSEVIADVMAGTHPTYTTTFTIEPPAPTI